MAASGPRVSGQHPHTAPQRRLCQQSRASGRGSDWGARPLSPRKGAPQMPGAGLNPSKRPLPPAGKCLCCVSRRPCAEVCLLNRKCTWPFTGDRRQAGTPAIPLSFRDHATGPRLQARDRNSRTSPQNRRLSCRRGSRGVAGGWQGLSCTPWLVTPLAKRLRSFLFFLPF